MVAFSFMLNNVVYELNYAFIKLSVPYLKSWKNSHTKRKIFAVLTAKIHRANIKKLWGSFYTKPNR